MPGKQAAPANAAEVGAISVRVQLEGVAAVVDHRGGVVVDLDTLSAPPGRAVGEQLIPHTGIAVGVVRPCTQEIRIKIEAHPS